MLACIMHVREKDKKGSFKIDVTQIWPFSEPLTLCHTKLAYIFTLIVPLCHKMECYATH